MSLFLDKESRQISDEFISIGFWWDVESVHKLISCIYNKGATSYYLFNFIKIWQTKASGERIK